MSPPGNGKKTMEAPSSTTCKRFCYQGEEKTKFKKQRYAPRDHYTSTMTVQNPLHCDQKWRSLREFHTSLSFSNYQYLVPFSYVYHLLYAYPALLPLARLARTQSFQRRGSF
jgi:hypothetical protein